MLAGPVLVIELAGFRRRVDELLSREEQDALIDLVAYEPACGDLIPGTGGLRKIRIGRGGIGKRGGARVIYYFYSDEIPIFLLAVYAKNEKADLKPNEKREFAALVKELVAQWQKK